MPLPGWSDLLLAATVGVIALVPAALAFLAVAGLLESLRAERWLPPAVFRWVAGGLAVVVAVAAVLLTWAWAGATHLKPRCVARGEPVYASTVYLDGSEDPGPVAMTVGTVLIDAPDFGTAPPPWAAALTGPGRFLNYEWRRPDGSLARVDADGTVTAIEAASAGALLTVRRSSAPSSYWARITVDRFLLRDRASGTLLADGEEMWVDAGPARYRCGIGSGPVPVRSSRGDPGYPADAAIARFVLRAVVPYR